MYETITTMFDAVEWRLGKLGPHALEKKAQDGEGLMPCSAVSSHINSWLTHKLHVHVF